MFALKRRIAISITVLWLLRAVVCVSWMDPNVDSALPTTTSKQPLVEMLSGSITHCCRCSFSLSFTQPALSLFIQRSPGVPPPPPLVYVCDDMLSLTAARMKNNAPLCESQLIWWMAGYMHFAALTHSAPAGLMQMDPPAEIFMELNTQNASHKRVPLKFCNLMRNYFYLLKL